MAFLLDTNVLSELRKGASADKNVRHWAQNNAQAKHFISLLSIGEIRKGIELLRRKSPQQCPAFEGWLARLRVVHKQDVLPVTEAIAEHWGALMALRTLPAIDGLLAATALEHGLTIVTRNTADFQATGMSLVNPFL